MIPETGPLAGLDFSDAAWSRAETAGLTREDFAGVRPAGKSGEILVFQVEEAVTARDQRQAAEQSAGSLELATSLWKGHTNYHCPSCPYASLDRVRVVRHVVLHHNG